MERYIKYRKYDSSFGDLVPMILANDLNVSVRIFDTDSGNMAREYIVNPANSCLSIAIQRKGDHFNGIIPSSNITPSSSVVPVVHTPSQGTMCEDSKIATEISNEHAPLPYPWSFDPLPPTTPLLTGLAMQADTPKPIYEPAIECELVANQTSSQPGTMNIFSRRALLEIRDNVPCVLK